VNNIWRRLRGLSVISLGLLCCGFLIAAGVAGVRAISSNPIITASRAPPNGTPGSEQPGTLGLARPHPPIQVR
jgi:hypothetical protein